MGLLLSIIITYAGANEAIECLKHIIRGVVPNTRPDFQDLVDYYTRLLRKSANSSHNWFDVPQGYVCLTEDRKGNLHSAIVKYYNTQSNSTALLFSTKISSFGQDSIEDYISNGSYKHGNSVPTKTKTMVSKSSESFSIGHGNRTANNLTINVKNDGDAKHKSTLHNEPRNPSDEPPEIRFQPYDDDKPGAYNEDFLRSVSRERRKDKWSLEALADSDGDANETKSDVSKLDSVDEPYKEKEVIEEDEDIDFWGIIGD